MPGMAKAAAEQDAEIPSQLLPPDSTSALAFSPTHDLLALGSWSGDAACYRVDGRGQAEGVAVWKHEGPVLDVCWSSSGTQLFSASTDKTVKLYDLASAQSHVVAAHDAPIRNVRWIDLNGAGVLATASWDRTLKYWDMRQAAPVASVQLPERAYAMDVAGSLLAVGTADRQVTLVHLRQDPARVWKTQQSPLKMQTRSLGVLPDGSGYAVASIEGRVGVNYLDASKASQSYTFRCHRSAPKAGKVDVYAVNSLKFNAMGTFATGGSDGTLSIWDGEARIRTKQFDDRGGPISAMSFSRDASLLAYATGYDWSQGHTGNKPSYRSGVFIHRNKEEEVSRRRKK